MSRSGSGLRLGRSLCGLARNMFLNAMRNRGKADRLCKEWKSSQLMLRLLLGNDRREKNDRHTFKRGIRADLLRHLAAIDPRHHDVEEDDLRLEATRGQPRLRRVILFLNFIKAAPLQSQFYQPGKARFIIHD